MQLDLTAILTAIYTGFPCPPPPFQFSCLRACFDEILTVCKQNVSCASVHLVLGVHYKCTYEFFIYTMFFTIKNSVFNSTHVGAIFTSLLLLLLLENICYDVKIKQLHHALSRLSTPGDAQFRMCSFIWNKKISSLHLSNSAVCANT